MKKLSHFKRNLLWAGGSLAGSILLLIGAVFVDTIPAGAAIPPDDIRTLEDFQKWKGNEILGKGTYEQAGVIYSVILAPAGRSLASGPSAYLFDEKGRFVDWTGDMGDLSTVKHRFRLMDGQVRNIKLERDRHP